MRSLSARVPTLDAESASPPQQAFVKTRLEPGEWDLDRKNPLYRPKYRSSARIIATDDFANRPTVGMNAEFESLQDAMVTLSWLDQNEQKIIYRLYLDLMVSAEASSGGKTSHEYVMRVIAQKFNLTAQRVAAVVQLQHNEQQMILENPDIELCDDLADEMDQLIKQEISDAYQTFNLKKPESFVEDPVNDIKDGKKWVIANDVFDVDQMAEDAIVREEREARLIIDGHVYVEDMDAETIPVPLDKDCKYLLKQKDVIQKKLSEQETTVHTERAKKTALEPKWRTKNGEGVTRERYKFVAQTGTFVCIVAWLKNSYGSVHVNWIHTHETFFYYSQYPPVEKGSRQKSFLLEQQSGQHFGGTRRDVAGGQHVGYASGPVESDAQ